MLFREFCNIRADGKTPYPFINAIRESHIICYQQYCKGEIFFCQILKSDLPEFKKLAESYHMNLTIQEQKSFLGKLKKYKFRLGVPLGIIASIFILFYYSNIITKIEIQGNALVSEHIILAILEQENIKLGSWLTDIDMQHCEILLRTQIPEIAWAGIRHTGSRLVVEITEETPHVEMLHENNPCHIISRYNAQITNVEVYSGQLKCLIGDGISKGDIIVSGIVEDDAGNINFRHAYAKITGIYTEQTELTEYFTTSQTVATGNKTCQRWFKLFNLEIPLQLYKPDYQESQIKENYIAFQFLGQELPCGIFRRTTEELQTSVTERSEQEVLLALH
ncbi:MAG: sporulation protein YqfD, partial [Oscillospiraceae bacterium]|nr:sporulation protein YqfD [Oscillospiraceae bacterium]